MQCLLIEKTSKTVTVYPSYPSTFNELPLSTNHISGCIEGQHSNGHFPKSPAGNFGDSKLSIPRHYYLLFVFESMYTQTPFSCLLDTTKQTKEKHIGSASSCSQKYMCVCGVCQLWNIKLEIKSN